MHPLLQFLITHRDWFIWPLLSGLLAVLSRKKTAQEWEAWALKSPVLALLIELARAAGLDPPKIFAAFKRYADRRAGAIPEDMWSKLPVNSDLKRALSDPAVRAQLEVLAAELKKS